MIKSLPIYISDFKELISNNYLYVDKTEIIYNLFKDYKQYYFLSRPRRFGKSLLVSTLKELFYGNKELFKNLWIYKSDWDWQKYPIIHLDFSLIAHRSSNQLESELVDYLISIAKYYSVDLDINKSPENTLLQLILSLSKINKVVILIDEYDKPILDNIKSLEQAEKQREILRSFYNVIKGQDANLRSVFFTGVTRFAKTSIFSGLNNLNDITLDPVSCDLLGYREKELSDNFREYIEKLAEIKNISFNELLQELKDWYNGYRFSKLDIKVYNPFSILYALYRKDILNYWFDSGTPTFLINLLSKQYYYLENISQIEVDESSLGNFDIENIPLITLLFQSGYLTISDYNKITKKFKLKFPNYEVNYSFTKFLVAILSDIPSFNIDTLASQLLKALNNNDIEEFCNKLELVFAHIPYTIVKEDYYHALFQFLLTLLSLQAQSEVLTNKGRIDLVLQTDRYIYIFEFKLNKSPDIAIEQIKDKKYYQIYLNQNKQIILVGISFILNKSKSYLIYKSQALNN